MNPSRVLEPAGTAFCAQNLRLNGVFLYSTSMWKSLWPCYWKNNNRSWPLLRKKRYQSYLTWPGWGLWWSKSPCNWWPWWSKNMYSEVKISVKLWPLMVKKSACDCQILSQNICRKRWPSAFALKLSLIWFSFYVTQVLFFVVEMASKWQPLVAKVHSIQRPGFGLKTILRQP